MRTKLFAERPMAVKRLFFWLLARRAAAPSTATTSGMPASMVVCASMMAGSAGWLASPYWRDSYFQGRLVVPGSFCQSSVSVEAEVASLRACVENCTARSQIGRLAAPKNMLAGSEKVARAVARRVETMAAALSMGRKRTLFWALCVQASARAKFLPARWAKYSADARRVADVAMIMPTSAMRKAQAIVTRNGMLQGIMNAMPTGTSHFLP
mmetsp:Transcript_4102/g.11889  ORF Transcript_4102/g.11889 Transcript_4102/m.11889 type:complete len:211 (+) Transcript_4102:1713-2345(+)